MPTAEDLRQVYEKYAAAWSNGDVDAVLALFAADAVVHVPVDGPAIEGIEKIREFFTGGPGPRSVKLVGPVHISGDCRHPAARVDVEVDFGDGVKVIEAMDVWTFDDDGRISTMNDYNGPTNVRSA